MHTYLFICFTVAERVVDKGQHKIDNVKLIVAVHHDCLGVMPPSHDHSTPHGCMPDDVTITDVDENLLKFVERSSSRKLLNDKMAQRHGKVGWDARIPGALTIACCAPRSVTTLQFKKTWANNIKQAAEEVFGTFACDKLNVLQDCWDAFLKRIGSVEKKTDKLWVTVERESCCVQVVGKTSLVRDTLQSLGKVHLCFM